ncbi:hypothetical protein NF552_22535 (plasmid) [Roseomonas mucosa]|nr:hypothetical protein NF552_22535 [Roseomonas mucosa]
MAHLRTALDFEVGDVFLVSPGGQFLHEHDLVCRVAELRGRNVCFLSSSSARSIDRKATDGTSQSDVILCADRPYAGGVSTSSFQHHTSGLASPWLQ